MVTTSPSDWHLAPCPVCLGTAWRPAEPAYRVGVPTPFAVEKCVACGLRRLQTILDDEATESHYDAGYYAQRDASRSFKAFVKGLLERSSGWVPEVFRTAISINLVSESPFPGATLLDVGCGSGDFLLRAQTRGWTVTGTELSDATARIARERGFAVISGPWEDHLPASGFDLIVMNHVLEHVRDPRRVLQAAAESLASGGRVSIGLPDFGCGQSRLFGGAWWANLPPEHVWFLERRHVLTLVASAGLRPVDVADLSRAASVLRPSIWRQQWSTWRVAGGSVEGFAVRAAQSFGLTGRGARGREGQGGRSTMYTLICERS